MGKEKIQTLEIKENERVFHYEILGIILLILTMLAIAKLGIVGKYLMLIVKILFGDWFFLVYGFIIAYSIRCILVHKRLKIINIRYLGIMILFLAILLLSHFNIHNFIKDYEGNHFILTVKLYFSFFKSESVENITGGGIIGAALFYVFYYLFSEIGVVLLSLILIFLGIVFVSKKTIKEFIEMIFDFFKKIFNVFDKTSKNIKSKINEYDLSYTKSKIKYKISKIDVNKFYKNEEEFAKRNVDTIKKVLNSMNVFYNNISYIICRNVTTYFINSYFNFSYEAFRRNLMNYFYSFQLKKDSKTGELLIEMNNINAIPLRICEVKQEEHNEVIFGIDDRNEFLKLDVTTNKLLICGENRRVIATYLDSIVLSILNSNVNIEYSYIDFNTCSKLSTSTSIEEVDSIIFNANELIEKMQELKTSNIFDYNNVAKKRRKLQLVIINGINKILQEPKNIDKITYLLEVTQNYGYIFIFVDNEVSNDHINLYNLFNYRLFLDNKSEYAYKCLKDYNFDYINNQIEGYLLYKSIVLRATMIMATKNELDSIR